MKIFKRTLLALFVLIVLGVLYFVIFIYFKPHVDYLKKDADIEIVGETLFMEFESNQLEASKRFNGKVLLVEGVIDSIEKEGDLEIAVMVFGDGFFGEEGIRFTMLENQIHKLTVGEWAAIKGFCSGFTGSDVIIEHASVVEPS